MKIIVDHAKCQGHAMCYNVASDVYELDDDGYNRMEPFEVKPEQREAALYGARMCPEKAITVIEE